MNSLSTCVSNTNFQCARSRVIVNAHYHFYLLFRTHISSNVVNIRVDIFILIHTLKAGVVQNFRINYEKAAECMHFRPAKGRVPYKFLIKRGDLFSCSFLIGYRAGRLFLPNSKFFRRRLSPFCSFSWLPFFCQCGGNGHEKSLKLRDITFLSNSISYLVISA